MANITESRPKKTRIMIFGAPHSPVPTTRFKQGEELPAEFREYLDNFLTPSLQKALHKDLTELTYKIILNLQAPKQRTHLVIELSDQEARQLLDRGKILVGFNSCSVKRYVNVARCFKCQRYGHLSSNCPNNPCCVNCGEDHPPGSLGETSTCTAPPNCINCHEKKQREIQQFKEKKINKYTIFTTKHKTSDRQCEVYKATLHDIQEKLLRAEKQRK